MTDRNELREKCTQLIKRYFPYYIQVSGRPYGVDIDALEAFAREQRIVGMEVASEIADESTPKSPGSRRNVGMPQAEPKYHPNQMLRCLHDWAIGHPPRPVANVVWDDCWNCYTYSFPFSWILIAEDGLEPSGDPDMTPKDWIAQYRKLKEGG